LARPALREAQSAACTERCQHRALNATGVARRTRPASRAERDRHLAPSAIRRRIAERDRQHVGFDEQRLPSAIEQHAPSARADAHRSAT
jgi:hypothetical protein